MSDTTQNTDDQGNTPEPRKVDIILERAVSDDTFREQLYNDFEGATKEYGLTQDDLEALAEIYDSLVDSGQIEVLDGRDNPLSVSCCCCSPCCCCTA
jgi:hypothetical protein